MFLTHKKWSIISTVFRMGYLPHWCGNVCTYYEFGKFNLFALKKQFNDHASPVFVS